MFQTRKDKAERIAEMLAAANTIIRDRGANQLTVASLAEHCDVSPQLVYAYFNNVTELERRVLLTVFIEHRSVLGRSGTGTQTDAYEPRIHMTLAAIHGFVDAELDGFIDQHHDPDRLFDELVHRCLAPYDLLPQNW